MATTRPFAFNNSGITYSNTLQYGNITIADVGCDITSIPLEWFNGCDEDLGYVIAHTTGQRQVGNNTYTSTGPVIGYYRSTVKTDDSFYNLYQSFRKSTGWPFQATAADAKTWLLNNGYWTSYTGSGGGGASVGNYHLSGNYSPATLNGEITFVNHNGPSPGSFLNPNLIGTIPIGATKSGYGIYINKYDSLGNDQSSVLSNLVGRSGNIQLQQNSNIVSFDFVSGAFVYGLFSAQSYGFDDSFGQSVVGSIDVAIAASGNFNTSDVITITVT